MNDEHGPLDSRLMSRARGAYELGRARAALLRAIVLSAATALAGSLLVDAQAWRWAPLTLLVWGLVWWRGGELLACARYGLAAGAVTFLLPLSLLRPCCRTGMSDTTVPCTMPEMCVMAGALVGMPLAALVVRRRAPRRLEAALGTALGVLSLAAVKCSALFLGEAIGLMAGVALGIAATMAINVTMLRRAP